MLEYGTLITFYGWLIFSPIIYIWFFFNTRKTEQFKERHHIITIAIHIGASLTLLIVLFRGIEPYFSFIPKNLGTYCFHNQLLRLVLDHSYMAEIFFQHRNIWDIHQI
jgi:hypothetical protein